MNNSVELEKIISSSPVDVSEAMRIINLDPMILLEKVGGFDLEYSLLDFGSLLSFHSCEELLSEVLSQHPDILNQSGFFYDVLSQNNTHLMDIVLNHPNYQNFNIDGTIINESFLSIAIKYEWSFEYLEKFLNLGANPLHKNKNGNNAFFTCSQYGDINTLNLLNNNKLLEQSKNLDFSIESIITNAIKHNNTPIFEALLPLTTLSLDELFNLSIQHEKPQILNTIIFEDDFLPGLDQLMDLTRLVTNNFVDNNDNESSNNIIDFLYTVKTPFAKFSDLDGNNIWNLAIKNHNELLIDKLLEIPELLNIKDNRGKTPILNAIEVRDYHIAEKILLKKPNLNLEDNLGNTPLITACKEQLISLISPILEGGAFTNVQNKNNESALFWATKYKDFSTVAKLLWHGAPISKNKQTVDTPSGIPHIDNNGNFTQNQDTQTITLNNFKGLVDIGFNLNAHNQNGESFPMHFLKNNQLVNFNIILGECFFDPNQQSPVDGNSMLIEAVLKPNPSYVEILFKYKGNQISSTIENNIGKNAIDYSIELFNTNALFNILNYCEDVPAKYVKEIFPLLLESHDFTLSNLDTLAKAFNHSIFDFKTVHGDDVWLTSLQKKSVDDIQFLIEKNHIPDFNITNNNNDSFDSLLSQCSSEVVDLINSNFAHKKRKLKLR